jgi:hypothetical protein
MWAAEAILKKDIDCGTYKSFVGDKINTILKKGQKVTITKGREYEYAVWGGTAIMDTPKEYIDEKTIKVISAE